MAVKLHFLGAAENVTGSSHLLEANGSRVLVDCGLYQERNLRWRNWEPFAVPAESIDAVVLTHAHLDHCGLLPKLVKEGFTGDIICTAATGEIAKIILLDSAKIQEEDAEHKRKRHEREGRKGPYPEVPLYTMEEAEACFKHFRPVKYKQSIAFNDDINVALFNAGHVLGSSIIKLNCNINSNGRVVLFSGDIGRPDRPIVCDPAVFESGDYVLIESTYGNRVHRETESIKEQIAEVINSTNKAGGNIIIPSFALERAQEVLYYINELFREGAIPRLKIFLDSPMASRITKVFESHPELFDEEMNEFFRAHRSLFELPGLEMTADAEASKAINNIKGTSIIIAGSGMCTGGRVKHHLVHNIERPESTVMFVGYQAQGTLGRRIVNGEKKVRILGQEYKVKANIVRVNGFSAHADRDELLSWLKNLQSPPREIFVVHGEGESAKSFRDYIRKETGWNTVVPAYLDEVKLD